MEAKEYQNLAMRTNDGKGTVRLLDWTNVVANGKIKDPGGLLNGCLGLSGEAGELNDLVKKWIFHKKPLDREHMKKKSVMFAGTLRIFAIRWASTWARSSR